MNTKNILEVVFKGISQVMLQNNVTTGILFLLGVFYNSWFMGIGVIIGVLVGTFTALFLGYNKNDINNGHYGFNGTLVGSAIICFFGFNIFKCK